MLKVCVNGALGRMGRRIVALLAENDSAVLSAAVDAVGVEGVGKPLAELVPEAPDGVILDDSYKGGADVIIDFSFHAASAALAAVAASAGTPLVIGTTGFTPDELAVIDASAKKIPLLLAPNMAVGVNVFFDVAARMARALGADFDVEIVEVHHRFKKDAPSGTALETARRVAAARGLSEDSIIFGRHGETGERPSDEIAIHALRAGDVVGDHTVLFSCLGERLELKHQAHTRDAFARGAVRAAAWLATKKPGLYSYKDVLSGP